MLIKGEGQSSEYPPLHSPNQNDASAFDNSDKCNLLNDYFCSITDLQDDDILLPYFDDRCPNTLTDITVVEQDSIEIISLLDPNKAVGPDRISNKMLREKIFPADWKLAHIIPIFKSGDKSSCPIIDMLLY